MKLNLLWLVLTLPITLCAQNRILIHAGTLIDGKSNSPQKEMSIIIEGNKIIEVKKGYVQGIDFDSVVDLSGYSVMPGLMDMHVHLEMEHGRMKDVM